MSEKLKKEIERLKKKYSLLLEDWNTQGRRYQDCLKERNQLRKDLFQRSMEELIKPIREDLNLLIQVVNEFGEKQKGEKGE